MKKPSATIVIAILGFTVMLIAITVSPSHAQNANIVQLDDTIVLSKSDLSRSPVAVEWQQRLSQRKGQYVRVNAAVEGRNGATTIFVQKSMVNQFISLCNSGGFFSYSCKITVSKSFQYGQNSKKTRRFLVYHDKSRKPFQHRFITTSTLGKAGYFTDGFVNIAGKYIKGYDSNLDWGLYAFGYGAGAVKAVVGDPLRNF